LKGKARHFMEIRLTNEIDEKFEKSFISLRSTGLSLMMDRP
jgi:hypothetical protein